ncbi:ImpA family type VI secretion system protein [Hydromonas duriensis]|uniref:Type VI secretion system protein ImpA n=1 Tax=Hydromonas duriensis TaxID=1527608 RepID=A0A4V3DK81_9BURK|nr:type VI secretion system ImpA family N-terminal domain-containing protein [Hydromonas duriensis]TDR33060.1 type VI secretion system protein ImpA [Hydromonas duriensis]
MNEWLNAHAKLLEPISADLPCGHDLEYDQDFILLFATVEPKTEAQYGDFTSEPESINWGEVAKNTESLLQRTKDIRLIILWLRAQINVNGARGLATGLSLLYFHMQKFSDALFPMVVIDGERDELYRTNALLGLNDVETILSEVRQIFLSRSNAFRLQVRDVERALASPRPSDAMPITTVVQQLNVLLDSESVELKALEDSSRLIKDIQKLANEQLPDFSPNFDALIKILSWFDAEMPMALQKHGLVNPRNLIAQEQKTQEATEESAEQARSSNLNFLNASHDAASGRSHAQGLIRQARLWFVQNEPSSPVVLLLQQAEGLIGKPFEQVFQAIPADLVEQWRNSSLDE